jgi:ABC-type glycerol-3-phosphate transport system substrate-binding protein
MNSHYYKIKFFFIILFIFPLLKCSDQQSQESLVLKVNKKKQPEIKFLGTWRGQGGREKFIQEFVNEYNFTHQDTKVVMTFASKYFADKIHAKKLTEQLKAKESDFDIIFLNNNSSLFPDEPDWPAKYLVDFSQYKEYRENTISGLLSDSIKKIWHGISPGPFLEGYYFALWTNSSVAKKMGIKVKQYGMTFDDFLGYIRAVHEYNTKHPNDYTIPLFESGKDWKTLIYLFYQLYASKLQNDELFFADKVTEEKLEAWHYTLKELEKLQPYEPLSPRWDTIGWWDCSEMMMNNKCLFVVNGTWMYNIWETEILDSLKNIMPAELPVFKPTNIFPGGFTALWAVPKNAPHKDEAVDFLLTLNKPKFAEKWIRYTKCPTGIKGKLMTFSSGADKFEDFTYHVIDNYSEHLYSTGDNRHIYNEELRSNINYAYEVLDRDLDADAAMEKVREVVVSNKVIIEKTGNKKEHKQSD